MADKPRTDAEYYVLFELAGTSYAVCSRDVQQMEMVENITPVPNTPPFVAGVVLLRGVVIPAIDLRVRFGFPPAAYTLRTRLVVLHVAERTVGLIVDSAREFVRLPADTIKPPPEAVAGLSGRYLEGVATLGDRVVLVLDPMSVLATEDALAPALAVVAAGQPGEPA